MAGKLRVTLRKSPISYTPSARGTVRALGLHRIGQTVEVADDPAMRGQVRAVRFLVDGRGGPRRRHQGRRHQGGRRDGQRRRGGQRVKLHDLRPGARLDDRARRASAAASPPARARPPAAAPRARSPAPAARIPAWFEGGQTPIHRPRAQAARLQEPVQDRVRGRQRRPHLGVRRAGPLRRGRGGHGGRRPDDRRRQGRAADRQRRAAPRGRPHRHRCASRSRSSAAARSTGRSSSSPTPSRASAREKIEAAGGTASSSSCPTGRCRPSASTSRRGRGRPPRPSRPREARGRVDAEAAAEAVEPRPPWPSPRQGDRSAGAAAKAEPAPRRPRPSADATESATARPRPPRRGEPRPPPRSPPASAPSPSPRSSSRCSTPWSTRSARRTSGAASSSSWGCSSSTGAWRTCRCRASTVAAVQNILDQNDFLQLLNLFSGGGLSNFSIVALGVNPYINASIIMQLMTGVVPRLQSLSREGEYGRNKINQYTRYLTVPLALLQAYGYLALLSSARHRRRPGRSPTSTFASLETLTQIITLTAGTILAMWIGELITERGIGNGISFIIFAGIVGRIPQARRRLPRQPRPGRRRRLRHPGHRRRGRASSTSRKASGASPSSTPAACAAGACTRVARRSCRCASTRPASSPSSSPSASCSSRPSWRPTSRPPSVDDRRRHLANVIVDLLSPQQPALHRLLLPADGGLHLLLHRLHLQARRDGRPAAQERRLHPGHPAGQPDARLPGQGRHPHQPRRRHLPGHRGRLADRSSRPSSRARCSAA